MSLAPYYLLWCGFPLTAADAASEGTLTRDVRVQPPTISGIAAADTVIYDTLVQLPDAELAAGQALLHRHGCTTCHQLAIPIPALDRLGRKTGRRWLYTLLKTPPLAQPGTQAHDYHLVDQDALDLSTYLVRRFAGAEINPTTDTTRTDSARRAAGLAVALDRHCFECHRIAAFDGPSLQMPVATTTARSWIDYHARRRGVLPAIVPSPPDRRLMAEALQTDPNSLRAAAHFLQVVVEVDPDYFYRSFFANFAEPQGLDLARQAHARLLDSPYILFAQSHPLE